MKKRIGFMALAVMTLVISFMGIFAAPVFADAKSAVCEGAGLVVGANGCETPAGTPDVDSTLKKGINLFSAVIGVITVVMFMIGGLKYITSQGDSGQMNSAKNTLIFAAVGLVVVALSQLIVNFVLERFTT